MLLGMETLPAVEKLLGAKDQVILTLSGCCLCLLPVGSATQKKGTASSGQIAQFPSPLVLLTSAVIKQHLC